MILVLHPHRAAECGNGEARDVAGGEHVVAAGDAAAVVDDDAVRHVQAGSLGELGARLQTEAGDDRVGFEYAAVVRRQVHGVTNPFDSGHGRAAEHLHAARPVVVGDERGQVGREDARTDARLRKDHRHRAAVHRQRGRDLGADEAPADHDEACSCSGARPKATVVVERSVVDDLVGAEGKPARPSTGGEQ